jgi:predicted acyl esterase
MRGNGTVRVGRSAQWTVALVAVVLVLAVACTTVPPVVTTPPAPGVGPGLPPAGLSVRAGIEQVYVTGAPVGAEVRLERTGAGPVTVSADAFGSAVFRELAQGELVTVVVGDDRRNVTVLSVDDHPGDEFYRSSSLRDGLNYIPMRDGTLLAVTVRPPFGNTLADGPFPTLIEYSGYAVAGPTDPLEDRIARLIDPSLPSNPLVPGGETLLGGIVSRLAGYATVSVQLRGTGCSGGEADLFDLPSRYDGYDVVETVARQPWVLHGRPGMLGISFSGFSQIATAGTRPPSLAAIAPLSFLGRLWDVGWPGGVFNVGFADSWLADRQRQAQPAPSEGAQEWANALVATDPYCRENQRLRLQTRNGSAIYRSLSTNVEEYDRRDMTSALARIEVPTFALLQFQDQETSSAVAADTGLLTGGNPRAWVTLSSGEHNDSISPDTIDELFEFLDIYVARRTPELKFPLYLTAPLIFGRPVSVDVPALLGVPYAEARRRFEERPRYTYGLERSDGDGTRWGFTSSSFPPAGAAPTTLFLGSGGSLGGPSADAGSASYVSDPSLRPASSRGGWSPVPDGAGLGFTSAPLEEDTVLAGPLAADLWVSSTAGVTDLQVSVSEVRPDGQEQFVTTAVQRSSFRGVLGGDAVRPIVDYRTPEPLAPGFNRVRVPILPAAHAFRAGSRIRVVIGPAGGDKTAWRFVSPDTAAPPTNSIGFGPATPSSITFPVATGVRPLAGLPSCPSAGQPCRTYTPLANGG